MPAARQRFTRWQSAIAVFAAARRADPFLLKSLFGGFAKDWQKSGKFAKDWQIAGRAPEIGQAPPLRAWQMVQTVLIMLCIILPIMLLLSSLGEWLAGFLGWQEQQPVLEYFRTLPRNRQILFALSAITLAPLWEEYVFRGILFPFFARQAGALGGVLFTAVLFAGFHAHAASFVPLCIFSVAACAVYVKTRSFAAAFLLHALYNAVALPLALCLPSP